MKTVSGMFTTAQFEKCQIQSFDNTVTPLGLWQQAPISGILGIMGNSQSVSTQRFSWGRTMQSLPFVVLGAALPPALPGQLTRIAISDDNMFIPSQVYEVPSTLEQVLVVHTQGTVAVFKRGVGSVTPQAAPAGEKLFYVGTANEEASFCPTGIHEGTTSLRNQTQIFRETWSVSGSAMAVDGGVVYNKGLVAREKKAMMRRMMLSIERARIFGQLGETVHNNKPMLKMEGLLSSIRSHAPQNIIAAGSTTSIDELEDMTDQLFGVVVDGVQTASKLAIGGTKAMRVINALGRTSGDVQLTTSSSSFGLVFTTLNTRRGKIEFVLHPMMDEHPQYENSLLVVEPNSFEPIHLNGRQMLTHESDHLSINCQDAMSGGVLAELSIRTRVPEANGLIMGLTEAACKPCAIAVTKFVACLMIDKPCSDGEVALNTPVTVSFHDAKPGVAYTILTPTGPRTVIASATGTGSFTHVLASAGVNSFSVANNAANMGEVMWKYAAVSACVAHPCENAPAISDSPCVDQSVSTDTTPAGNNATANSGADVGCC